MSSPSQAITSPPPSARDIRIPLFERRAACRYCGKPLAKLRHSTADHITPTSKGGETHPRNVTLACKACNSHKADRTPFEVLCWALKIVAVAIVARIGGAA